MKRSTTVKVALLLSSLLTLAACGDDDDPSVVATGQGLSFDSYEDCAINIGAENCQKTAVPNKAQNSNVPGASHSSFVFLPIPMFSGGYMPGSPRYNDPRYDHTPAWSRARSSSLPPNTGKAYTTSTVPSSAPISRGGFGSTARGGSSVGA